MSDNPLADLWNALKGWKDRNAEHYLYARIPRQQTDVDDLPDISVSNWTQKEGFRPYLRDPQTLARPWAIPGTKGLQHRVGGIEKEDGTGNISYTPANHNKMVHVRQAKVDGIAHDIPPAVVQGDADADVCLLGWGSTWGAITSAMERFRTRSAMSSRR